MSLYFGISSTIIGDIHIDNTVTTHYKGFQVSIFDENGTYRISFIKRVNSDSPLKIKYSGNTNNLQPVVPDESAYAEYLDLLKHFEALGGFNYGIREVNYRETLQLTWYIGGAEFQNLEPILSFSKLYPKPKLKQFTQSNLSSIFLLHKIIPEGIIPYNFFREASEYLNRGEFRQAYLQYYLILEYCFSNGKTSLKQQIDAFLHNNDFILALLQTIKCFHDNDKASYDALYDEVIKLDAQKNQSITNYTPVFSIETITRLLYDTRGRLAHGTGRVKPYIFNEALLRNITHFISSMCFSVCGNMQVYASAFTQKKDEYVNNNISQLKECLNL